MTDVVVIGSANLDVVVPVDRHPAVGETVLGGDHKLVPGGKGANQAVAAARLGASVALVGRTGVDPAADVLRRSLAEAGVDTAHLIADDTAPSGLALITVGPDGDNSIVVSPGANARVGVQDVAAAGALFADAAVVLAQLEIPIETVTAAARASSGTVILDPAPAPGNIPAELLDAVDVIVPNETELAVLAGAEHPPVELDEIARLARSLPVERVVVTLGRRGAAIVDGVSSLHVAAPEVRAADTTGAGDAFRAALAVGLGANQQLEEATRWAVRVGAAATLRVGAQPSMPTIDEVDRLLGNR